MTAGPVPPPDTAARAAARARLAALAKPVGALGAVEDLAAWWAAVRGDATAPPPAHPALVVFASDHGIVSRGVSAYPAAITAAMVRTFLAGGAAASVLAVASGVALHVVDVGVDADWEPGAVPAAVVRHKVRRGTAPLDTEDALSPDEFRAAAAAGTALADALVDSGHDLLLTGDMGIGNTTAAAAVIGALTGAAADVVVGRGTGVDDEGLARKTAAVAAGLARVDWTGDVSAWEAARRLGGPDIVAMAAYCVQAARRRTPVLLDGVVSGAAALVAGAVAPGSEAWFAAGHRSTEPAHALALSMLRLRPVLDLDMRLGEGSGALMALPVLRHAVTLMAGMATLDEVRGLLPGAGGPP